jgi:hypothetical protein
MMFQMAFCITFCIFQAALIQEVAMCGAIKKTYKQLLIARNLVTSLIRYPFVRIGYGIFHRHSPSVVEGLNITRKYVRHCCANVFTPIHIYLKNCLTGLYALRHIPVIALNHAIGFSSLSD